MLFTTNKLQKTLTMFMLCAAILTGVGVNEMHAQAAVNSGGGKATGSGGSVDYSTGLVFFKTVSAASGSVAEGVQQPYEISVITSAEEAKGINLLISAYPNPTSGTLYLEVKDYDPAGLICQLLNQQGNLMKKLPLTGQLTSISLDGLPPAVYFVKLTRNNITLKLFKIIKH